MKSKIYVIGSSNTDMVVKSNFLPKPGETVIGDTFLMNPGGKGANQAVSACKLGADVTFITKVGNDMFGKKALNNFKKIGIKTDYIRIDKNNSSGVAIIMVDKSGENSISVAPGANNSLTIKDVNFIEEKLKADDYVLIQLEIPKTVVEYLIEICNKLKVKLILNPAPFQKISDYHLSQVNTITPNEIETEYLSGIKVKDKETAKKASEILINKGIKNIIITMGEKGAFYKSSSFEGLIPTKKVSVIDSTAAGDTFNGALVAGLSMKMDMLTSIDFANNAATYSVTKLGAQSSAPSINDLNNKFLKYVHS
ncbi:MAG: ribokinase [Flavobacteriaceae bacterium]|tara:strand:- start:3907 stop:4836 length:930 start_codon:yes stop_codon:yes gene_type:complete